MKSDNSSASNRPASPATKRPTSSASATLRPFEIEQLRRNDKEASAYAQKVFKKAK